MRRWQRHPFASRFLIASGLLFVIMLVWGLASPIPSGPDESAQLIKAAAVARGTLIGTPVVHGVSKGEVQVRVPATILNNSLDTRCNYHNVRAGACLVPFAASSTLVDAVTYEGRYPPLYYFLTGLPTLVSSATWVLHAMRAVDALILALLLGLAFSSVATYARSGSLTIATGLVITPTVLYLGGIVNPSGIEVGGAIALWAALAVMVFDQRVDTPRPLVATAVIGAAALCSSRPLSTLWYALIIGSFVVLRPAASRALLQVRRVRLAFAASLVFAVVCGLFVVLARSYEVIGHVTTKQTTAGYLLADVGHGEHVLRQLIGAFGSPNFVLPVPLLAIWIAAGFGTIATGLTLAVRRDAVVLLGLTALFGFLLPFAIIYSHIRVDGVIWQGRYSLPLLAGLPMLAAELVADRYPVGLTRVMPRVALGVVAAITLGQVAGFYWFLRRYTVGLAFSSTNAFRRTKSTQWKPVFGPVALFVVLTVAELALGFWLLRESLVSPENVDRRPVRRPAEGDAWRQ